MIEKGRRDAEKRRGSWQLARLLYSPAGGRGRASSDGQSSRRARAARGAHREQPRTATRQLSPRRDGRHGRRTLILGGRESQSQGATSLRAPHTANYAAMIFVRDASSLSALLHANSPAIRPCRACVWPSQRCPSSGGSQASTPACRRWQGEANKNATVPTKKNVHDSGARLTGLCLAPPRLAEALAARLPSLAGCLRCFATLMRCTS